MSVYTNFAMSGLNARLVEELAKRHRNADDDATEQQIEDTGNVGQLERTGCFLLKLHDTLSYLFMSEAQHCSGA